MYTKIFFIIFLIITFFLGLYVTGVFNINTVNKKQDIETFEPTQDCPNLLVRKNDILLMYNTNKPIIENVNPMPFYNLDEYINFVNIQREKGMQCPVLFLQHENNAQGEDVYRARPSPFDMQGGLQTGVPNITYKENTNKMLVPYLDASKSHPPYNKNQFAGFDPYGQHIGQITELDLIHKSTQNDPESKNPMDPNWGGVMHTQSAVKRGDYKDREVYKPIFRQEPGAI